MRQTGQNTQGETTTQEETTTDDFTTEMMTTDAPAKFGLNLDKTENSLTVGQNDKITVSFTGEEPEDKTVYYTSSNSDVVAVTALDGSIRALTPGEARILVKSAEDERVVAVCTVTVSDEGVTKADVTTPEELNAVLETKSANLINIVTDETVNINIAEADYSDITLVINAPNAHVENAATFKHILIKAIANETYVEQTANLIFFSGKSGHIKVSESGNPSICVSNVLDKLTITNDGKINKLFICNASKVIIKGKATEQKINCENQFGKIITTYVPMDINSATKCNLNVGPGGEQTTVKVKNENNIPEIKGIGNIPVTIEGTGENKTIIAEKANGIVEVSKTNITGKVVDEAGAGVAGNVYLVEYTKNVNLDNISTYLNALKTKNTTTEETGSYSFNDIEIGNHILVFEGEGCELITSNIVIPSSYANTNYEAADIVVKASASDAGSVSGVLTDGETGEKINVGIKVFLRKGMNNLDTELVDVCVIDTDGSYKFENLEPGQYTIQIEDESIEAEYESAFCNVAVPAGNTIEKNITVSKKNISQKVRFILTWDAQGKDISPDLDLHMYGPNPFYGGEYGIHYGEYSDSSSGYDMDYCYTEYANLDADNKHFEGPEIIKLNKVNKGQYKIFVKDYSNGGVGNGLAASNPIVRVYVGDTLIDTLKIQKKSGGVWFVGVFDGETRKFTSVNEVYDGEVNTSTKAEIAEVLNKLTQFKVENAAAFAKYQSTIDIIKQKYLAEVDEEVLGAYLKQISEILKDIEDKLSVKSIKVADTKDDYNGYISNHYISTYYYSDDDAELVADIYLLNNNSAAEVIYENEELYRIVIRSEDLGVSTNYYYDVNKTENSEYWVEKIRDKDDNYSKCELNAATAIVGGKNSKLGKNLEIKLMYGVELVEKIYREDVSEWTYGDEYSLVLKLKKTATEETKDFLVRYIIIGTELKSISDNNNTFVDVKINYSWMNEVNAVYLYGKNAKLGNTLQTTVEAGANAVVKYTGDISGALCDAQITVTTEQGGSTVYEVYYYQDTSEARILGIYSPDNIFTYYEERMEQYGSIESKYYIELKGVKSTLGNNLKLSVLPGAVAEIEYIDGADYSKNKITEARITVTAASGIKRIYYIIYSKSEESTVLRSITSDANELISVVVSEKGENSSEIIIKGQKKNVGALNIKTISGYSADFNENEGVVTVKKDNDTKEKNYSVEYSRDVSALGITSISSEIDKKLSLSVDSNVSSIDVDGVATEYYKVKVIGNSANCPTDLVITGMTGSTVEVTYKATAENWKYNDFAAAIEVNVEGIGKILYLVEYSQDDTGADVYDLSDDGNKLVSQEREKANLELINKTDLTHETVNVLCVMGDNAELGQDYQLNLPDGARVAAKVNVEDENWPYVEKAYSYAAWEGDEYYSLKYKCVDRIVVEAANGAQQVYVVAYLQDTSGAVVTTIADENNEIIHQGVVKNKEIKVTTAEGSSYEVVDVFFIKGNNTSLGDTYTFDLATGASVETKITLGNEAWKYTDEKAAYSYTDANGKKVEDIYTYTDAVVIRGANGGRRAYMIAYCQDASEAEITKLSDEGNSIISQGIEKMQSYALKDSGEGIKYDYVDVLYVMGNNAGLGSTYTLEMSEGAKILSKTAIDKSTCPYTTGSFVRSVVGENSETYEEVYNFAEIVVVEAPNKAQKKYIIAYAQDKSGAEVKKLTVTGNTIIHQGISQKYVQLKAQQEGSESEIISVLFVKGDNASLGNEYTLDMPEGASIVSNVGVTDESWPYVQTEYIKYEAVGDQVEYNKFNEIDRIIVEAPNGAQRTYLVAYMQDNDGIKIREIKDNGNTIVRQEISDVCLMKVNGSQTLEEVTIIYLKGKNVSLGNTYTYDLPEGSSVSSTINVIEGAWPYEEKSRYLSYVDETGQSHNDEYKFTDRFVVESANGLKMAYIIAYAVDMSDAEIIKVTDEYNEILFQSIGKNNEIELKNPEADRTTETIDTIFIRGKNKEIGNTYDFELKNGSRKVAKVSVSDENWPYSQTTGDYYYEDENGEYVDATYTYVDRFVIESAGGVRKAYVIAYLSES